jgi:hypothetical protein
VASYFFDDRAVFFDSGISLTSDPDKGSPAGISMLQEKVAPAVCTGTPRRIKAS